MSCKQPCLNNAAPIEQGTDSSCYQLPLKIASNTGVLKHHTTKVPQFGSCLGKDGKIYSSGVEPGNNYPTLFANCDTGKRVYRVPPQYPVPPVHPPAQRRSNISVGIPQRYSDEELMRLGPVEMLKFVRKAENETARVASEQSQTNREAARRIQNYVCEIRALKESNQHLSDDNQELRDLCCFLDDDRQKGRKLAREWQRFGRYTASVMRQEVSAYQKKLRELESRQQELIKDNLELKELCLYLDEERSQNAVCAACGSGLRSTTRDDGDGSSSSTNADEPVLPAQFTTPSPRRSESRERLLEESIQRQRTVFNVQMMHYVRSLEQRMKQLEDEKKILQHKLSQTGETISSNDHRVNPGWENELGACSGRPEAVVQALQVLEVREQLERMETGNGMSENLDMDLASVDLDDDEKALVREMCNVVWRKLEDGPTQR
ncbi:hypothetical protein R5R35_013467 [Gryllus longicercus]|uniref:Coiled-coil domain-containing protein 85C n=1 Tax=Gryllus longicercus TaxID=2509291 RepID=A0AAN9VEV7_9ORTH